MAQTLDEILTQLKADFVGQDVISNAYGLPANANFDDEFSKVSIENAIIFFVGIAVFTIQKLFDVHKLWVNNRAAELKRGSLFWYAKIAKEFQYGSNLALIDGEFTYAVDVPAQKIVTLANASRAGKVVVVKVANQASNGVITPLSIPQKAAFDFYMNELKIEGVTLSLISRVADDLKLYVHAYIDPLVLAADGSLLTNPTTFPLEDAINDYIANLPFDGVFSVTELVDAMQAAVGIVNPVFENASAKYGANAYALIVDHYTPNAGYLAIDSAFPLSTTITYLNA